MFYIPVQSLDIEMTVCHVAIAMGGSWHGNRERLLMLAAGVKTQSAINIESFFRLSLKSFDIFLHINERPEGFVE